MQYFQLDDFIFDWKTQTPEELFWRYWLLIQMKEELQRKKNENLQGSGLDLEKVIDGGPTF